MGGETRWLTYEDMGVALGITSESEKRLAMRHKWPRRPSNDGRVLVAVPEKRLEEAAQPLRPAASRMVPMTTPPSPPVTSPMMAGATPVP
jgi:hypothetical protein